MRTLHQEELLPPNRFLQRTQHVLQKCRTLGGRWRTAAAASIHTMWVRRPDPASLQTRLVLIPTALLFLGMIAALGFILGGAHARVQAELHSGTRLGRLLIRDALKEIATASDPEQRTARLAARLPQVRHVEFALRPAPSLASSLTPVPFPADESDAPQWFLRALAPPSPIELFPIIAEGRTLGDVEMRTNPSDEIDEIWSETQLLAVLLGGLWVLIVAMICLAVRQSLRPMLAMAEAFDQLERGQFHLLPPIRVAELRRIGMQFNRLGRTLERAIADNRLLIDRMMSVQEAERKELARELHDEFGPALFGIRADASCILRSMKQGSAALHGIEERARSITTLADGIQRTTYHMLDRLRPLVLEQMGLSEALRQLVSRWQARYPALSCSLHLEIAETPVDEGADLAIYRIVQECLTNVIRHAKAKSVVVTVGDRPDGIVQISVVDDGVGFPAGFRFGFGLLGMAERARQVNGRIAVRNATSSGASVEISIPRFPVQAPTGEQSCASC